MDSIYEILNKTVSISEFNRGQAGKIFEEVNSSGSKIVLKNNKPECILLSPREYASLIEKLENAQDLALASERIEKYGSSKEISKEEFAEEFHLAWDEIEPLDESEIE